MCLQKIKNFNNLLVHTLGSITNFNTKYKLIIYNILIFAEK